MRAIVFQTRIHYVAPNADNKEWWVDDQKIQTVSKYWIHNSRRIQTESFLNTTRAQIMFRYVNITLLTLFNVFVHIVQHTHSPYFTSFP